MFSLHRTQGQGDHGRNRAKWGSNSKRARRAALQVSPHSHWLTTWVKGLSEESGLQLLWRSTNINTNWAEINHVPRTISRKCVINCRCPRGHTIPAFSVLCPPSCLKWTSFCPSPSGRASLPFVPLETWGCDLSVSHSQDNL